VPSGWRLIRVPKSRLIRSSTSRSHWLSAVLAWHSRIFLACMGTIRSASSAPVSAATDGKYSRRRSSRNSSWPPHLLVEQTQERRPPPPTCSTPADITPGSTPTDTAITRAARR